MATNADSGIKTVAELIDAAKTRSTPLLFGTPGVGSGPQLAIELFALRTGLKFQHIPFKGSEPAATELVAGRLDFMMDPPSSLIGFVRGGRLNALAVSGSKHYFALPQTPTLAEAGVPGISVSAWQGLIAPAGLPDPILRRLNTETVRILNMPETKERMHGFGNEPAPTTPEQFKKELTDDIALWTNVAEQIHFEKI
jgi:tripartite-type tricarboxylate transporter receptor subunit TctC